MRRKTLREKEKLLVMSNFSFSHSVFKRLVLQTRKNQGLFGKGLPIIQTAKFKTGSGSKGLQTLDQPLTHNYAFLTSKPFNSFTE